MGFLNRLYLKSRRRRVLKKWRSKAVRKWRRETGNQRWRSVTGNKKQTGVLRLLFIAAVCVILILSRGKELTQAVDSLIQFRYIDQRVPVWEASGTPGNTTVEEGISIQMDDKAVSIFRVEEHTESPRYKESGKGVAE